MTRHFLRDDDLTPAEHNHPLWGPEFKNAKNRQ